MNYYSYRATIATLSTIMFLTGLTLTGLGLISNDGFVIVTILSVLFTLVLILSNKRE